MIPERIAKRRIATMLEYIDIHRVTFDENPYLKGVRNFIIESTEGFGEGVDDLAVEAVRGDRFVGRTPYVSMYLLITQKLNSDLTLRRSQMRMETFSDPKTYTTRSV